MAGRETDCNRLNLNPTEIYAKDNHLIESSVNTFHYMFDCRRRCPPHSCGQSMVRLQQSTQTLNANDLSRIINRMLGLDYSIQGLMNTFMVVILTILLKDIFKLIH